MDLKSLGYVGIHTDKLEDWADYGSRLLGLQLVERTRSTLSFRMDDRKQRIVVHAKARDTPNFFGWEVADATALDNLAARLDNNGVAVRKMSAAEADCRSVKDCIAFRDPVGNQLEAFYGADIATTQFKPGRTLSGFRTGTLGVGHAVLTVEKLDEVMPFYTDLLGFKLSDYVLRPFKVYFFHINQRHHSLALLESGKNGIHHLMLELYNLDDVGQGYDIALGEPDRVATTLGRHINDLMTLFYTFSPSDLMVECGWGGKSIEPETWQPFEVTTGPSFWGHERSWLSPEGSKIAREMRLKAAAEGVQAPLEVMEGNYKLAPGLCPWFDATARAGQK